MGRVALSALGGGRGGESLASLDGLVNSEAASIDDARVQVGETTLGAPGGRHSFAAVVGVLCVRAGLRRGASLGIVVVTGCAESQVGAVGIGLAVFDVILGGLS